MPYKLPECARPFALNIPEEEYQQFKQLLELSHPGPLTWENQQQDRTYGVTHEWLISTKQYWAHDFNWRAQEQHINSFPNFKMNVQIEKDDIDLHFVGLFSEKEDAIPLVLLHGWPGSFIEFLPVLKLVQEKYEGCVLPYHVIIPSLPGYTLSSGPPKGVKWTAADTAEVIDKALNQLGFVKYIAQGGDVGRLIATLLGMNHKSAVAVHLNLLPSLDHTDAEDPLVTLEEKEAIKRSEKVSTKTIGAAILQATKPATIGAVLSSNPLALLAWIGEKFLDWTEEDPHIDHILTNASLYWFTECMPRCIYTYRGAFPDLPCELKALTVPFGYSWFMHELVPVAQYTAEKHGKLVFYRQHRKGGHFAALERPSEFLEDMEDFMEIALK